MNEEDRAQCRKCKMDMHHMDLIEGMFCLPCAETELKELKSKLIKAEESNRELRESLAILVGHTIWCEERLSKDAGRSVTVVSAQEVLERNSEE